MTGMETALGVAAIAFVIFVAYQIGKFLLRLLVGLAVLALLGWGVWRLFLS
jgi:hypothetical protein